MEIIFKFGLKQGARALLLFVIALFLHSPAFAGGTVTLMWDRSPDADVQGYTIYYGQASGSYSSNRNVGNATTITISNLVEGASYFFVATAYNSQNLESDPSNEVAYSVPVTTPNQPPTLNPINNVAVSESSGQQTVSLSGISSGASNEVQTLSVSAASSNPDLIPNPIISYTSPAAGGTLVFAPVSYAYGSATITVTVNDGAANNRVVSRSFTVIVNPVNQAPTLNAIGGLSINQNAGTQTVSLSGISSGAPNEAQTLTVTAVSSNPGLIPTPTVGYSSPSSTATLNFTPVANASGSAVVTVTVYDGDTSNNNVTRTFTVTVNAVNQAPTLNAIGNLSINQNAGTQTVNLSGIGSGAVNETQTLSVTAVSSNPGLIPNPTVGYTSPNATGTLNLTPVANTSGSAVVTVTVNDGGTSNNIVTRTFTVTVNAVNQAPTLNAIGNVAVVENSGQQTVNLSGITSGATNEAQTLSVTATSSDPALIPNPIINYSSPAAAGILVFAPVAYAYGSATITVTVNDGAVSNNVVSRTFTVTVNEVNQAPTLNAIGNLSINQNAGTQTVSLSGIGSGAPNETQTLSVTAVSSSPGLVPNPTIGYTSPNATGTLNFTPVANASGSAVVTVTVNDGGTSNNIATRTFTVTVNAVNQAPTLNAIGNLSINQNAGTQTVNLSGIGSGAPNETQTLSVTAVSSSPGLVPNPTIGYTSPNATGTLNLTPVANASGSAVVTVTVNDGGTSNNIATRTFTVTVNAVNQAPTLNAIGNLSINQNAGSQTVSLSGIGSGAANEFQTLTLTAVSGNPGLIPNPTVTYTSPNGTGTLNFNPVFNAFGSTVLTVTVNDGGTSNNVVTRTFTVTVIPVNQKPTMNSLNDLTINQNSGWQIVELLGISSGSANEAQTLVVSATSDSPNLIPAPIVTYTSPNSVGSLKFKPSTNGTGLATIGVTVNDGGSSNNLVTRYFTVFVDPVNQAPTLNPLADVTIGENADWQTVTLQGISSGAANESQSLIVTATSDDSSLIPNPSIIYATPGATGSLKFKPALNAYGLATITVTVNDGGQSNNVISRSFTVFVDPVNQPPTLNPLSDLTINENAGWQTVNLFGISSGAANEAQVLVVTAASDDLNLVPEPIVTYTSPSATGSLKFKPVANASGIATIRVSVNDGGTSNNVVTRYIGVFVDPVNQPPTLNGIADLTISENANWQTVNLSGISSGAANETQTLVVSATSDSPDLVPAPTITYSSPNATGSLKFKPATNSFGIATIAITVNDGGASNNIVTRYFTVFVDPVNQAPTLNPLSSLTLNGSPGPQVINLSGITSGRSNENQTLTVTATSSNPGLIPHPSVNYGSPNATGSLSFVPASNGFGTATITVRVSDGQAQNNIITRSFTVYLNAANEAPVISVILNQKTVQDSPTIPIPFSVSDRETPLSALSLQALSSNPALVPTANIRFQGSGADRTITITPASGRTGQSDITVLLSDGTATSTNTFRLSVMAEVTLLAEGGGRILPYLTTTQFLAGGTYTFSASPEAGNDFAGWTGSITSRFPSLTLLVTSNMTLVANFIPSPFVAAKSSYNGLFHEEDQVAQESAGSIAVSMTAKGSYSGRLQIGKSRYSIRGQFDKRGEALNEIPRVGNAALRVELRIGSGKQADRLFGRVHNGVWDSKISGDRAIFNSKTAPAPFAGTYTMSILGEDGNPAVPTGDGYASLIVKPSGSAKLIGTLADGTKISQGAMISKEGLWPAYLALYKGNGSFLSWLAIKERTHDDLNGLLSWIKPADPKARLYSAGFTNDFTASGSVYSPQPGRRVLDFDQGVIAFEGGDLPKNSTTLVSLGLNNRITNLSSNRLTMSLSFRNGTFSGKTIDPSTGKNVSFNGAVLQKMNMGSGFLLGTNRSSRVMFMH